MLSDEGTRVLVSKIIGQAIKDYTNLLLGKTRDMGGCSIKELESFFRSDYCGQMLDYLEIKPEGLVIMKQVRDGIEHGK